MRQVRTLSGPSTQNRPAYALLLAACALMSMATTWDVAWHAAWHAESASWQRVLSLLGLMLAVAGQALWRHTDLVSLRLLRAGLVAYLVALPLDALNHRSYGVNTSSWGLAHLLLYSAILLLLAGLIRGASAERARFVVLCGFFLSLDVLLLPNGELDAPAWFYPVYGILAATLLLLAARTVSGQAWAASLLGLAYVGYRCLSWLLFSPHSTGESTVPLWLLPLCLAIDMTTRGSWTWPARIALGTAVLTGVGYTALALQSAWLVHPRVDHYSALATCLLLGAAWALAEQWYRPRAHPKLIALLGATWPASDRWTAGSRRPG